MSESLKPCPFCGSTDIRNVSGNFAGPSVRLHAGDEIFAVDCHQCGASVPNRYNNDAVIRAWNTRADARIEAALLRSIVDGANGGEDGWVLCKDLLEMAQGCK